MSLDTALHFLWFQCSMSLLAVGGVITLAPDMHRKLVDQEAWLSDAQFNASITLAQVVPGPNVLFIALFGWHVGLNAAQAQAGASWAWVLGQALLGVALALVGTLGPSSVLAVVASRWVRLHQQHLGVRAFRQGLAPIVVGVLLSTAVLLGRGSAGADAAEGWREHGPWWALSLLAAGVVWRTRLHLLWLLAAGGVLGVVGVLWVA